jgi:DNA invertase Pin-like site-specific DNA recombinase
MYLIPKLEGKEIIMYLRKSRSDDPLASVSEVLEKHESMLDDWMATHQAEGGPIPEELRFREVVSGETLTSRPRMLELLRKVEDPKIRAIICKEPSRLSRGSLKEIGHIVEILRYTKTLVITLQYTYDLNDDRDRELFERELMRGNEYLQYTKKILQDGKLLAAKSGQYIGQRPPYGYKKVSYKDGRKTCRTLEPIPEEAEIVKRIFDLYISGIGSTGICEMLEREHARAPQGKNWSPTTISNILFNVHYLGKVRWNYRKKTLSVEDGEIRRRRLLAEDYLVFDGLHDAIIDQEQWDAVHKIKGKIPKNHTDKQMKNPLAKIMYCSCGKAMAYKQNRHKGVNVGLPRLGCSYVRCRENGSVILQEVLDEIAAVLREGVEEFEMRIEQGTDNSAEIHRQLIQRLERKLVELQELEIKQWDEKTRGGMPDHVFHKLNAQTVAEIEGVTQALCEAKSAEPEHVDLQDKIITFRAALDLLSDPDAPVKELNRLLQACIERIDYSRPRPQKQGGKQGNPEPFRLAIVLRV